jgi:16S rRNA (adenine1518-N6/adenine1519-N6)-dimethyltransferase
MSFLDRTKEICRLSDFWPKHNLGQNFLISEDVYDSIIAAADLKKDDVILEVGPGCGFLTAALAKKVKKVISVEIDPKIFAALDTAIKAGNQKNIELINQDILQFDTRKLPKKYKIVANLPYNITSIFLRQFWTLAKKPQLMVLLLQKEVAERICAKPPKMSILSVAVQFYGRPDIVQIVRAANFWPAPKVDSALIKIAGLKTNYLATQDLEKQFFSLVRCGFSSKRKMLKNNLANGFKISPEKVVTVLEKLNFNPLIRAENLSVDNWLSLFAELQ